MDCGSFASYLTRSGTNRCVRLHMMTRCHHSQSALSTQSSFERTSLLTATSYECCVTTSPQLSLCQPGHSLPPCTTQSLLTLPRSLDRDCQVSFPQAHETLPSGSRGFLRSERCDLREGLPSRKLSEPYARIGWGSCCEHHPENPGAESQRRCRPAPRSVDSRH